MTIREAFFILDNQIGYDIEKVADAKKQIQELVNFIDIELPIYIADTEKILKDSEKSIEKFTDANLDVATIKGAFYHNGLMQGKLDTLTYLSSRFIRG